MRKLSGYGPSLIVLVTAMLVLFLGPSAVQQLTYTQTQVRIQQASQRFRQQRLADASRPNQQNITLLQLNVVFFTRVIESLVMIVNSHG